MLTISSTRPDLGASMQARAVEAKRESIATDYVLHYLGLDVCSETLVRLQTASKLIGCMQRLSLVWWCTLAIRHFACLQHSLVHARSHTQIPSYDVLCMRRWATR